MKLLWSEITIKKVRVHLEIRCNSLDFVIWLRDMVNESGGKKN